MVLFFCIWVLPPVWQKFVSVFVLVFSAVMYCPSLASPLIRLSLPTFYCPTFSVPFSLSPLLPFLFLGSSFSFPLISAIAANSYIWNRVGTSYSCDFTLK